MKLRSLQLHGFKSFADRTEVEFHQGMTAIVGPNGCGKSNISDAVRWVLGEQRPTAIRGARMEEAIFQGTVNRRPVNRGSVTMTVSNEDGRLPIPFEEVEIGRTVYREGGSEYSINRSQCRLRDVQDLCRDTGLGANAYAVIENRMIDAILSDRAEERRGLFEEAAGIGKYKDRRRSARRRLENAERDLERVEDLIAEVRSKVRSLARQKSRAERYVELRERRLDVEVAVVRDDLARFAERLEEVTRELEGTGEEEGAVAAELRAAEAELEDLRLEQLEAERARSEAAEELDAVKSELVRWERDLAVAEERETHARRRLGQIEEEREAARERAAGLDDQVSRLEALEEELATESRELDGRLREARGASSELRDEVMELRERVEALEEEERTVARRSAQLEGDAEAADDQAAELARHLERLEEELEGARDALTDLDSQGDLFSDRLEVLAREVDAASAAVDAAEEELREARDRLADARRVELDAEDRAQTLAARRSALESMVRDREGVEPVVRRVLARGDSGILGSLADFVDADPELAPAVEAYLGSLLQGVVVGDRETARSLAEWFADEWEEGGGLVLLPLDAAPEPPASLAPGVEVRGEGAPWARALLAGVDVVEEGALLEPGEHGRGRLARSGASVDRMGIVRVGNPGGGSGILERRQRLEELREEESEAREAAEGARARRERAEADVREAEGRLDDARSELRAAEDERREADAEVAARSDRRERMDRQRAELARQIEGTRAARDRALARARTAREDREALAGREDELRERRREVREELGGVESRWEDARARESGIEVRAARAEGELERTRERLEEARSERRSAVERIEALDAEEEELSGTVAEARALLEEGEAELERLFGKREEARAELRETEEAYRSIGEGVDAAEKRAREARAAERAASEDRHKLELERQELSGKIERVRDRLEGEWGRPLEELVAEAEPVDGELDELRDELESLVADLGRIGPVNMLAVEEHEEESQRLDFLQGQREDLVEARNDLEKAIRQINQTATFLFLETFEEIREHFRETFRRLFQGGESDIWLEDPDDPLESPIEIHASPRGKKTQRIHLLSGGERALTALSLLFGIYLVKPSPFCVLDEVDAPLDEANIGRFIRLLEEFKDETQFVVITHNPRTIEAADWIYGVTMEEPGVSSVVGVRLEDALEASGAA